jgi:hypothetical protein
MDLKTQETLGAAEESVAHLVDACRKEGPLYGRSPRAVAQVSRTAKWLLHALAGLRHGLKKPPAGGPAKGG